MSLWSRIFGPKPRAIVDDRLLNEDWRTGDLAVCTGDAFRPDAPHHPRTGDLLRVCEVSDGIMIGTNILVVALSFVGKPAGTAWPCTAFRKIRPAHDAADAEFCAEIRRWAKGRAGA